MSTTSSNKKAKDNENQGEDKSVSDEPDQLFAPLPECQDSKEFKIQDGFEEVNPMAHIMSIMLQYQTFRSWTNYSENDTSTTTPKTQSKDSKSQVTTSKRRKKYISKRPIKEKKRAADRDDSKRNCKRIKSDIAAQENSPVATIAEYNNSWQETLLEVEKSGGVSPLDFSVSADGCVGDISRIYDLQNIGSSRKEFYNGNYPLIYNNNNTNEMDDFSSSALQSQGEQGLASQHQLQLLAWQLENSRQTLLLETQLQTVNQLHQIQKESWNRYMLKMSSNSNKNTNNMYVQRQNQILMEPFADISAYLFQQF